MNLTRYRKVVDAYAPPLGHLYRSLRDQTILRKPIQTKYGFSLAGDPEIIREDWESDEKKTFLEIMDKHDVFLDIGANVGFYSCLVASHEKAHYRLRTLPAETCGSSTETYRKTDCQTSRSFPSAWQGNAA